ncbi:MAG: chorismate mutase [Sphingomonadales bacterium]|nr:chorismate mutase [Sphingomonadales bacterium]
MARDLSDLRRDIDAIDDQLHDLVRQRTKIVEEVRASKEGDLVKIRPEREAEIIYRLFAQHEGKFPKRELFRIWRELINATLSLEGPFSVGVFMEESDCGFWDLARDQYGSYTPMTAFPSTRRIIEAVQKQEVTVGILPIPARKDDKPWWRRMVFEGADTPRVIARLPFVSGSNARSQGRGALVISPVAQQPTGRDRTYLVLESVQQLRPTKLAKAFGDVDLPVVFSSENLETDRPQVWQTLIEIDSFVTAQDPRVKSVEDIFDGAIKRVVSLGGYATPVTDAELG